MLNFPVPYPDELVYSIVARAGVHAGFNSALISTEVFHGQKAVATVDLPSYLQIISEHYPESLGVTAETLAYKHTLFPLYAPFISEPRRLRCLERMKRRAKGTVHRALGVAVSQIRRKHHFRLCPECMQDQLSRYGEYYWSRRWQAPGCKYCFEHAELSRTGQLLHDNNLFAYTALAPNTIYSSPNLELLPHDKRIEKRTHELFELPPGISPDFDQWYSFYRQLAHDAGLTSKSIILHDELETKVLSTWSSRKLYELGIPIDDRQNNWLRRIMRKAPKAFNCLQHIVVLESLLGTDWHFRGVIAQVRRQIPPKRASKTNPAPDISEDILHTNREAWLEKLKSKGVTEARWAGGEQLYRWLYKHDRNWLLQTNKEHRKPATPKGLFVDWHQRDKQVLERLEAVKKRFAGDMYAPRQSKRWYLAKADCRGMVHALDKLPLSASFLATNSEDASGYQTRRITQVLKSHEGSTIRLSYHKLLELSGLNKETMKQRTKQFLRDKGWTT